MKTGYCQAKMIHIIPFDLGYNLNIAEIKRITSAFEKYEDVGVNGADHIAVSVSSNSNFDAQKMMDFWQSISLGVVLGKKIQEGFKVYFYKFGIGILVIEDTDVLDVSDSEACAQYSRLRQKRHEEIYNGTHPCTPIIKKIFGLLYSSMPKRKTRNTYYMSPGIKKEDGIYYVMSLDFIETNQECSQYKNEYSCAAEPPVRCGESHQSGL